MSFTKFEPAIDLGSALVEKSETEAAFLFYVCMLPTCYVLDKMTGPGCLN